jgi:hypothetical protein
MSSEDDPEARIRELERSLNDQAAASELGGSQPRSGPAYLPPPVSGYSAPDYGTQQPYTTPTFGSQPYDAQSYGTQRYDSQSYGTTQPYGAQPYGTQVPAPRRRSSGGIPWVVFGLIAVVLIAVAAGAAIYTRMAGIMAPDDSKISGGSGTIDIPGIPSMPSIPAAPNVPGAPGAPGADSEVITASPDTPASVSGVDNNKTVACVDGTVTISGIRNIVNITGHCVSVSVSGMNNEVSVDAADTISANGFDNKVNYRTGTPQIDTNGSNSVVQAG